MKILKLLGLIFSGIGLIFFGLGLFFFTNTQQFLETAVEAKGVIVEYRERISTSTGRSGRLPQYQPLIEFTSLSGEVKQFWSNISGTSREPGKEIPVLYPPGQPDQARQDGIFFIRWLVPFIMGILCLSFLLPGGLFLFLGYRQEWMKKRSRRFTRQVQASITEIRLMTNIRINGRSPYRIFAQWMDPQSAKMIIFKSELLKEDPSARIKGRTISVRVHDTNPRCYWMDTDFLKS